MIGSFLRLIGNRGNGTAAVVAGPRRHAAKSVKELVSAGDAANRDSNWPAAEKAYAEALQRDPQLTAIWVQYGHSLKEQGHFHEAESAYRQALALDSQNDADTYLQLGHVLKLQRRLDDAVVAYRAAQALDGSEEAARELHALAADAAVGVDVLELFDRKREPAVFRPDLAVVRCDTSDVRALHLLLLGRVPESGETIDQQRGRPVVDVTRDLLQLSEFHRFVLVPLMAGRGTRHEQLVRAEFDFAETWLDKFTGADDRGRGWPALLRRYLALEPVGRLLAPAVVAALEPVIERVDGRKLIGRVFGQDGLRFELLIDGNVAGEAAIDSAHLANSSARSELPQFHIAIPTAAFDGDEHEIVVRDARTQQPLPAGCFIARLVPLFEGRIVASCVRLAGWVKRVPTSPHCVTIALRDGDQVLCAAVANRPIGDGLAGEHGFELEIPPDLPATAEICLDGFPAAWLTGDAAKPMRVSHDTWQITLGRSDITILPCDAIGTPPLPLGFSLDGVAEGVRLYGHDYVLVGLSDLAARGGDLEVALGGALHYAAAAGDYPLFRRVQQEWLPLLASRPLLFEAALRLCLRTGDLTGADQLMALLRAQHEEITVGSSLLQAMLDTARARIEKSLDQAAPDPFSIATMHPDAANSTYHTLRLTIERQRLLIDQLLDAIEEQAAPRNKKR